MDFFPSFVEMAGGSPQPSPALDGESFVPLLRGATALKREALHWHFPHRPRRPSLGNSGAIRKGNYKLVEKFSNGKIELYDLSVDLGEKKDLAAKLPAKTKELLHDLRTWRNEVGAFMPAND